MSLAQSESVSRDEELEEGREQEASPSSSSFHRLLGLFSALAGLMVAISVCSCAPLALSIPSLTALGGLAGPAIQQALALIVLGTGLGLAVAVEGWRIWKEQPAPSFHPRHTGLLWLALTPLLAVGFLISIVDTELDYLLPLVNTLTMILLVALILNLVGRSLAGTGGSYRDVLGGLVSGASLGTGAAIVVEIALAGFLVLVALGLGLMPGGLEGLESLAEQLEAPSFLYSPDQLSSLLSPAVIAIALTFVAVVTPLIEETTKTLGIALAGWWARPSPRRAFLQGVASGAGFALAENLLNGGLIGPLWGAGVLSRVGATLMHCGASGLVGWGLGSFWAQKRIGRLILGFVGALALHGAWNGLAVGAAVGGVVAAGGAESPTTTAIASLVTGLLLLVLIFLASAALLGMLRLGRILARPEEAV